MAVADPTSALNWAFALARADGLTGLPTDVHRGRLNGVTGHVGVPFAEVVLVDLGYIPVWYLAEPMSSGHGVDLLMLTPHDHVVVVEVK